MAVQVRTAHELAVSGDPSQRRTDECVEPPLSIIKGGLAEITLSTLAFGHRLRRLAALTARSQPASGF